MSEAASVPATTKVGTAGLRSGNDGSGGSGMRTPSVRHRKATFSFDRQVITDLLDFLQVVKVLFHPIRPAPSGLL